MEFAYFLVGLILVAGVGGVVAVMPSKRDRFQARVRAEARQQGLIVESVRLPRLNLRAEDRVSAGGRLRKTSRMCVRYRKRFTRRIDHAPTWMLLRDPSSSTPIVGWRADDDEIRGVNLFQSDYWQAMEALLRDAPEKCWGVQALEDSSAWLGIEQPGAASFDAPALRMSEFLDRLEGFHATFSIG